MNDFPTHVAHLRLGTFVQPPLPWNKGDVSLYDIALQWLTEDRAHRRELELEGRKMRGAKRNAVRGFTLVPVARLTFFPLMQSSVPSDSESFYKKCAHVVPC